MVQKEGDELTKTERIILDSIKHKPIKEIAIERKCTERAIYKHLSSLKKKGIISDYQGSKKGMPDLKPLGKRYYRLHNLHFIVTPYYFYERYKTETGNSFYLGKWHIFINSENIEIQSKSKSSFDSNGIDECVRLCRASFERLLPRIENRVGCEIIKNDKLNVRLVNHHLAEVENGIANLVKDWKLEICDEKGKVWAIVDKSKIVPEIETVDPLEAVTDAKKLEPHYNAMRKLPDFTVLEIKGILGEITKQNAFITNSLNTLGKHIIKHDSFIRNSARVLGVAMKKLKKTKERQSQKKLGDFF